MIPVLGIDPGSRNTGVVVRHRDDLLAWELHVRKGTGRMPTGPNLRELRVALYGVLRRAGIDPRDEDTYVVGVESLAYWPEKAGGPRRHQGDLYGTAMVYASVLTRWPDATVVDSGRGVANLHPQAYPPEIRPPVNGAGKDGRNHVRAAWDHSYAAETTYLQHQREAR